MNFNIKDTFNKELPADPDKSNTRRQVFESCYSSVIPRVPSNPQRVHITDELAFMLGLKQEDLGSKDFLEIFSGPAYFQILPPMPCVMEDINLVPGPGN